MRQAWILALLLAVGGGAASAQTSTQGAINGTITDASGAVVAGARVTAAEAGTGAVHTARTNRTGAYLLNFLPPGTYTVQAEAKGFAATVTDGILVTVGERATVDLSLKVGTASQDVTVTGKALQVAGLDTPMRSNVITSYAIDNLPLNGREWIQLATLVPGALSGNVKRGANRNKGVEVSFNGARDSYNSFSVDGADSTDAYENTLISSPPLDAIKEFRVETNMYSALYGNAGGAAIQAVTNSGTNQIHGSAYEYHRNKALDAMPAFSNKPRAQMPNYLWNQFGGSVGGPIVKNKAFFYFSGESLQEVTPGNLMVSFAPTAAEAAGDVSGTTNPWSGQPTVLTNPFTGQVISSGVLPSNLETPVGQALMKVWSQYQPNYPDPFANLHLFRGSKDTSYKYLPRLDYYINANNMLFGTFDYDYYNDGTPGMTPYGDQNYEQHDRTVTLNYTHIFGPTAMNNLVYSNTSYLAGSQFALPNQSPNWNLYAPLNQITPRILFYTQGYRTFSLGNDGPLYHRQTTNYLHDTLSQVIGNHSLAFGVENRLENYGWSYDSGQTQDYFGLLDGYPGYEAYYGETGSVFTDVLTGMPALMEIGAGGGGLMPFDRNEVAGFVQDDWKLMPGLNLSLGLRYSYESPFQITNGQMVTLDWNTGLPQYCSKASPALLSTMKLKYETGGPCRDHKPDYRNFAPRLGFSYQPVANTVVRGGWGMFYNSENAFDTTYDGWVQPFGGLYPWYAGRAQWNPAIAPGNPLYDNQGHFTPLNEAPYGLSAVQGRSLGYFLPTSPYFPTSYVEQYNLSLDHAFGRQLIADAAWVGSRGVNLAGPTTVQFANANTYSMITKGPDAGMGDFGVRQEGFNSYYNALQLSLTKQTSHGLYFMANYSWSHALTDMSNDSGNETLFINTTSTTTLTRAILANADFDVPNHFTFSAVYQLPVGKGQAFGNHMSSVLNAALGGWTASSIITMQSGLPFTVYTSSLFFPDRVCNGNLPSSQRTATHWFDYKCFVTHPPTTVTLPDGTQAKVGYQGDSPPNVIGGPGLDNWDLELQKGFQIGERAHALIQGQFFNAFNHLNLQAPSSNYFFNTPSGAAITRAASMRDIQLGLTLTF